MPDPKTPSLLTQPSGGVQVQLNQPPKPGKFTPTLEEGLAIPLLLAGAFLSGRNTPMGSSIGNVLGMGGGMLEQHGQYRLGKTQSASSVHEYIKQFDALDKQQTPGAYALWQQLKPSITNLDPDDALQRMDPINKKIDAELGKIGGTTQYYNRQSGGFERHNISEFPGGKVPDYLIPTAGTGNVTAQLWRQKWNVPDKTDDRQQTLDTIARAAVGTDYATVNKTNPQLAMALIAKYTELTAQPRADIQESKDFALLQAHENAEMAQKMALLNMTPRGAVEAHLMDREGITPGALRALPADKRQKLYDDTAAKMAAEAAAKAGASTVARATAGMNMARDIYLNQPIKDKFFAVNPKTFAIEGSPDLTMKQIYQKGLVPVSAKNQQYYEQAQAALANLNSIKAYGAIALPDRNMTSYGMEAYLDYQDKIRGDVSAHNYRTARIDLIAALRAMAKVGRPNPTEAQAALNMLENVSSKQQLYGAIGVADKAIKHELQSHISSGLSESSSELNSKVSDGAMSGMRGGDAAASPDPGYGGEISP